MYYPATHPFRYSVNVHANCICNEYKALTNRHLVDQTDIPFDAKLWRRTEMATRKYWDTRLKPATYEEIIAGYTGTKKRSYHQAAYRLRKEGLLPQDTWVSMFVKPDRFPSGTVEEKAPRAIQFRSQKFNLALGSYIKPIEEHYYKNLHYGVVSRTRVIAKGLNNQQRAELVLHKVDHFQNPVFVLIDHSAFDSTISVAHLKSTHRKYDRCYRSKQLRGLLKTQLNNKCMSKHGIRYTTRGTRKSGDYDTGCGNSIVNADAIYGFLSENGITKYDFILDGDDAVIIVEKHDAQNLRHDVWGRLGFKTKMKVVRNIEEVEFCQSRIILGAVITFSRNPTRAMSNAMACRRYYTPTAWPRWLAAVGLCEAATNRGVPCLQSFGLQLAGLSTKPLFSEDMLYKYSGVEPIAPLEVTADARATFTLAWGIPFDVQLLIEQYNYTACVYDWRLISDINNASSYTQIRRAAAGISAATKSVAEFSGSCWWSSSETGPQLLGAAG